MMMIRHVIVYIVAFQWHLWSVLQILECVVPMAHNVFPKICSLSFPSSSYLKNILCVCFIVKNDTAFFDLYVFSSEVERNFKLDPWVRGLLLHQNEHAVVNVVLLTFYFTVSIDSDMISVLFGIIDLNIIHDEPYAGELGILVIIAILNICKDLNF